MAKRLNIGVDVDGVLADFTSSARKLCKELFNGRPDDSLVQTTWAFESLGITAEEEKILWKKIDTIPNWWLNHKPLAGVDENLLNDLCRVHRVIFMTNRKDGTGWPIEDQTKVWLRRNLGVQSLCNVVISDNKGPVAQGLNLHYFIDDRPKNYQDVVKYSPSTHSALLDTSYNQELKGADRVESFNEFAQLILGAN